MILSSGMMNAFYKTLDMKTLDLRIHICRRLWDICSDPSTNSMSRDRLIIELKAGGVSPNHLEEVKKTLASNFADLDFLDFLTYIPLFLAIHNSIIKNPFFSSIER